MDMIGKVKRMHFRDHKSFSVIARKLGLSRNTVKKWVRTPSDPAPRYQRGAVQCKLSAFEQALVQMLRVDIRRPRKERRTVKDLYAQIKALGYEGSYSRVTDFTRAWHEERGRGAAGKKAYTPLRFELGEAFEFDWSEEGLLIGGIYRRLQVAHLKLCSSRAFWLSAYPGQGHEMLFDAHARAFTALGGIPRRGIYDNMKTAVDKVKRGKERVVNARFAAMCAHYLLDNDFCNVASGWEKGVVEKNVQDSRRRIWLQAARQRFGSIDELNVWLGQRCKALWSEIPHPEHPQFSIAEMLEHEQDYLMPMPEPFDGYVEQPATVSKTCLVTVERNQYSVPCELAGQVVSARLYPNALVVVAHDAVVACHGRLGGERQTRYDWQHYIPLLERKPGALRNGAPFRDLPEPLQQLRRGLLLEPKGDRVLANVLSLVPKVGLDAVLVAVELALESCPPSGRVSAEHVQNVLARLQAQPMPPNVETALQILEPPRADTARYDRLRAAQAAQDEIGEASHA